MGEAILKFKPRESLTEFTKTKGKVSLLRRTGGKKSGQNMAIHGENLASLAALVAGSGTSKRALEVDVIYIDPPYNVGGNQGYRNTWKGESEKERDWAGDHGAFLDFMEPRLKIGRQLLAEDGVFFISICDGEYCRLKILMDQIFGEANCIGTLIWNKNQGPSGQHISVIHEYILVYAKNKNKTSKLTTTKGGAQKILDKALEYKDSGMNHESAQKGFAKWVSSCRKDANISSGESFFKYLHPVTFRPFKAESTCAQDKPETRCHDPLIHPVTKKPSKVPKNGWKWKKETLNKMIGSEPEIIGEGFVIKGKFLFGVDEETVPRQIYYLDEKMSHAMPSVLELYCVGHKDLPPGISFTTPKPVNLVKELIKSIEKKNLVVLDYFAGSGATAQAVHELNDLDGGSRSWILIEEMGSTFHNVLIPRIEYIDEKRNFSTFDLKTANVGDKSLIKMFNDYSFDFLSAYHQISDKASVIVEGLNVIGLEERSEKIVAMTIPTLRKHEDSFIEELATLKDSIKKTKAKSAVIYTIRNDGYEEPWVGLDKSLLSGTTCKSFDVVEIPEQLVQEWNEVLTHMAA
ncbi:MAG: site-specific DNA-methyltransferase [Oligoflexales bacterium]